jgi:hypothetical protein
MRMSNTTELSNCCRRRVWTMERTTRKSKDSKRWRSNRTKMSILRKLILNREANRKKSRLFGGKKREHWNLLSWMTTFLIWSDYPILQLTTSHWYFHPLQSNRT